tara:strand:- start:282 stop:410 length:129 start_codon:yes stop_codon:yes gene_type:complete
MKVLQLAGIETLENVLVAPLLAVGSYDIEFAVITDGCVMTTP